jgi:hypothetical protein
LGSSVWIDKEAHVGLNAKNYSMKDKKIPYVSKIDPPGENWNNALARRQFLVRTGKAGAVTILALHGLQVEVMAEETLSGSANI